MHTSYTYVLIRSLTMPLSRAKKEQAKPTSANGHTHWIRLWKYHESVGCISAIKVTIFLCGNCPCDMRPHNFVCVSASISRWNCIKYYTYVRFVWPFHTALLEMGILLHHHHNLWNHKCHSLSLMGPDTVQLGISISERKNRLVLHSNVYNYTQKTNFCMIPFGNDNSTRSNSAGILYLRR